MATDGASNGWALDVDTGTGAWGAMFYVSHDPPVTLIQSRDLAAFISDALDLGRADRKSNIAKVHQFDFASDSDEPDYEFSAPQARTSSDPMVARFAAGLANNFQVYDLRALRVGMGFDWTPSMPDPRVIRDGTNMIFAIEQKPKKAGFFTRLFGRSGEGETR